MKTIKEQLHQECKQFLESRFLAVTGRIENIQESLQSETKSSAGDKHETGRAMLQLEREKAGNQLKDIQVQQETFSKVNIHSKFDVVCLGSLVKTNVATYFIAISVGKIVINDITYFAISPSSPIGQMLLGKTVSDTFMFNGIEQQISDIC
jgi:transcription elongation GreA/GreB family factor